MTENIASFKDVIALKFTKDVQVEFTNKNNKKKKERMKMDEEEQQAGKAHTSSINLKSTC